MRAADRATATPPLRDGRAHGEPDGGSIRTQHPRGETVRQSVEVVQGDLLEKADAHRSRDDGDGPEKTQSVGVQQRGARQDCVANRRGHVLAGRPQNLCDEERVSTGAPMELVAVHGMQDAEHAYRLDRERRQGYALRALCGRETSEYDPEWMSGVELVVAIRDDDQRAAAADASSEQPKHVHGRFVCPVDVLENEDGRLELHFVEQTVHDFVCPGPRRDERRKRIPGLHGDVDNRTERPGREQRLARAGEHPHPFDLGQKRADERALADARLAADEHETSFALRGTLASGSSTDSADPARGA